MRIGKLTMGLLALWVVLGGRAAAQEPKTVLTHGWQIQSSEKIRKSGETISSRAFRPVQWYPASMPLTVLAALVANKVHPDPFFGMNLRSIPGTSYPIGRNFSTLAMPDDSPFRVPWWFRTTFALPPGTRGRHVALHFDGINYRANIWLNGRQIARSEEVAGTYRLYEFDVTGAVKIGTTNVLAVEVFPPEPDDLAWTWVDWNPAPPDKNMGLWRPVYLTASGGVVLRHLQVVSQLDPGFERANLTVSAEVRNLTTRAVRGLLRGRIEHIVFTQRVELGAGEAKVVRFPPEQFAQLRLARPRLWWPAELGPQNLYRLDLGFQAAGSTLDEQTLRFGIRETTSEFTEKGGRLFKINGRPLLIRGGGWAPDMLLRSVPERQDAEMRYVRDMHLNAIRLEGKLEDDRFFDLADQYGILILAGWCCCDTWEQWGKWKPGNAAIAAASQRDQICRLRNHPSVLVWMNGSDNPPPADIEQMYIDILKELEWPNPYISSATAKRTTVTGTTGVKMTGPYDWVPPAYWVLDDSRGGAHGFNTETSPGAAVPPIESLRRMLPADHLWPIDDVWNYHAGGGQFRTLEPFTRALTARYGAASDVEDYATKAQLMAYEGERAMFEAYARNKYASTGVIQWMLNNAWPSMIWHLYDYFLRPGGGYFGAKKACEPVHVQYSYDDRSVVFVNGTDRQVGATIVARVLNLDLSEKFAREMPVDMAPDSTGRVFTIPELAGLSPTYFVDLRLVSSAGRTLSSNLYWLSTTPDDLDWEKSTWFMTPVKAYADFSALETLPAARVTTSMTVTRRGAEEDARVTLRNPGRTLAFFVRLQIAKHTTGEEVLPVLWEDNYISLWPGETRVLKATYNVKDLGAARPKLVVSGWNVPAGAVTQRARNVP
jgi:exo-1,4-beta-D-glucosaminidase